MKPSIPKGTRDFMPQEMARRQYIFSTIRSVFQLYGYQQIETPAIENLTTLMGKYGEEGDKLLFKILNSGDWLSSLSDKQSKETDLSIGKATTAVSEKGLRYDLTVPFARFVVQHRDQLQMPFRRFQIQPVWRADRPQKGRYREFYQCDVDVVGTNSLLSEVELIEIVQEVYRRFGIRVCLHLNNRKVLAGIAETIGAPDKLVDITVAIDKLDKIGIDKVNEELLSKGLTAEAIESLQPILNMSGSNKDKLATIETVLANSEIGMLGVNELKELFDLVEHAGITLPIDLDLTLARGLNYYTGAIFEVKALDVVMGSITGGGRYDNLTGIFGMPGLSGVGISFGADRIYDVLNELNLYPETLEDQTQVLFVCFGEAEQRYALRWAAAFRQAGINTEVYPDIAKMKKQMSYADQKHIPMVAIVGTDEIEHSTVTLKNMLSGKQAEVNQDEAIELIRSALSQTLDLSSNTDTLSTEQYFDKITARCREIYKAKMQDYGPSWRIMRPQTVNDQLFIKAMRIRELETTGVNLVGESVEGELWAIVNYSIIGLIQLLHGYADTIDMTADEALALYDKYLAEARALMLRKNHDYGEAWRDMMSSSLTDIILTKINRNKSIAANDNQTLISEGADGNYYDMLNYAIFSLIKYDNTK